MCLSVRVALTPLYVQVMQRKTSLSQEQVLRVRIPPCIPYAQVMQLEDIFG